MQIDGKDDIKIRNIEQSLIPQNDVNIKNNNFK